LCKLCSFVCARLERHRSAAHGAFFWRALAAAAALTRQTPQTRRQPSSLSFVAYTFETTLPTLLLFCQQEGVFPRSKIEDWKPKATTLELVERCAARAALKTQADTGMERQCDCLAMCIDRSLQSAHSAPAPKMPANETYQQRARHTTHAALFLISHPIETKNAQ
jgi:hypothetical protein